MFSGSGPTPEFAERPTKWQTPDLALRQAIQTAENERVVAPIGLDQEAEEVMATAPRLSPIPLDSLGGQASVETVLSQTTIKPNMVTIEFFTENWMHPRLAQWGKENGFVPSTQPIKLEDRVGHFDHAPYAFSSSYGKLVHPTPLQTSANGRVFLVEWDRRSKAYEIVNQIIADARDFVREGQESRKASSGPFPPRTNGNDGIVETNLLRHLDNLSGAFGVCPGAGTSPEYGRELLIGGVASMRALLATSATAEGIRGAESHGKASRESMIAALDRLWPLGQVLIESTEAWEVEVTSRENWMANLNEQQAGA